MNPVKKSTFSDVITRGSSEESESKIDKAIEKIKDKNNKLKDEVHEHKKEICICCLLTTCCPIGTAVLGCFGLSWLFSNCGPVCECAGETIGFVAEGIGPCIEVGGECCKVIGPCCELLGACAGD
ncbi:MAG: hypothetical protein K940chlam3_01227 [Chlamydiae bacterium]|nr:hypothetical protein [Chlamydiota bacterium]